jgi:outer membrane lipoprotein-sorting protein
VRKYRVLSKGNTNSVVMVTEPASERGQILLMKGRDLWVFMPDVSQPIRLSLSQRLTGQVANGDLARANFAADYNPKLLRSEKIGNEDYHVLELTASTAASPTSGYSTGFGKRTSGRTRQSSIRSPTAC